ncbi:M56 family metallopeptidase [Myxococcaceae bacterium GXIMD 01537]
MSAAISLSLGWALLHLLWQGVLVAAALALALLLLDRRAASVRYALACGALALMLALPALTGWSHYTSLQRVTESPKAPAPSVTLIAAPMLARTVAFQLTVPANAPAPPSMAERTISWMGGHMHWLVLAWGLGVAVSSLRLLSGWLRLRRLVREAEPAPAEWQQSLENLARRLGMTRPVRLLRSAALDVPAAVGWLRPVVLLPVTALAGLPARQLEMVLAHELAHIRRYDFAVNLVQTLVETLLFYHPAVWWMSRVIRAERENCCDDIAVRTAGNAVSYARALTALEALRVLPLGAASPAMSALGGSLTARVRRLVGAPAAQCSSRWVAGASLVTLLSGMAVAVPLAALALPERPTATAAAPASPAPEKAPAVAVRENEDEDEDNTPVGQKPLSVEQFVSLKVAGITPERVKELESLGYEPTVGNLVSFGHARVTPEYVKEMTGALGHKPNTQELLQLKHLGVTPERVKSFAAQGYGTLSASELTQAAALGVDERFMNELKSAGYDKLPINELIQLRALGVNGQYIQSMKSAGYGSLPVDDLTQFKALGVSAEYLRALREAGLDRLPAEDVVQLRALGVDARFIRQLRESGLNPLSVDELVRLKSSGVDADFIRALRKNR